MNIGKIIAVTNSEDLARENEHRMDERETPSDHREHHRTPAYAEHVAPAVDGEVRVKHHAGGVAGRGE